MQAITLGLLIDGLRQVGIGQGDGVLVHSAIQYLGRPEGGVDLYRLAFEQVLGPDGTLAVPAFNFGFARGATFDARSTPSEQMGVFAEHIRTLPQARRSAHPLQSVAVIGRHAADVAGRDTPSAFDPGSAFERMLELDFKAVFLGATIQVASIVHYSEQKARVPYRTWKTFEGTVVRQGQPVAAACRMYARDLALDPQNDFAPVQRHLEAAGSWRQMRLNYGNVAACRMQDIVDAADRLLAEDAWALVRDGQALRQQASSRPGAQA